MKVRRRIWLVMATAVALGTIGCRAAGTGSLSLHPRAPVSAGSLDVGEFIAEHNRNAELIQSLEARPSIAVAMPRRPQFPVEGRLAMERPRNFRLELSHEGTSKADLGSNDEEFWFWVSNTKDPSIYWCNYANLESSPLAVTYQPDWIIEAMGLRPISAREAEQIQVQKGPDPGTTALVFPATRNRTENYTRVLIVSNRERRIKQLRIHAATESKALIAQAEPSQYKDYPAKPEEPGATRETCYLPEKLVLDWKRDQAMRLEVVLLEVKLNEFEPGRRSVVFAEPEIEGYQRKNLAGLNRGARQPDRRTTTRQTMPAPSPSSRNGIKLGRPAPLSDDDPVVPTLGTTTGGDSTTTTTPAPPREDLVGAPMPSPPNSPAATANFGPPSGFTIER
jgi:hypothetical protein